MDQRRVVEFLGEGSFGHVLKCSNFETGTMEAVKVMKSCTDVIEIAKHEIQILKQLRRLDPNTSHVVRFNSFFFNMEDICLSFEFLDVDLDTYISEMSPCKTCLPLPEVRHITEQLVMALHHLKTIGIIHMDIKPENVMIVDHHEKPLQVKLVDFGGAQMSGNIDFETCIFTQVYSSAEVLLESEMNEALDMWSLGVTAFELAVGTVLFPYNRCNNHVLDKGQQTEQFFNRRTNDHPRWTIKTAEEDGISEKEEDFSCFDDVVGMLLVQQEHATGLDLFMDLIKNMLQVDPNQRITPMEALQHPFFTVKEETVKELEATSKERCVENIQLTNYAVDQLEKPEHILPNAFFSFWDLNSILLMTNMIRSTMIGSSCMVKNKTYSGEPTFLYKLFLNVFFMFLKTSLRM
uniref:Protein kinase domain-containing protein n=1 Tax=Takifugu rubripes TaxID=31033 RepID=A0A674MLB1_TAKRU